MNRSLGAVIVWGGLLLAGCGGGDSGTSPTPTPPSFSGNWRGSAQDNVAGAGTFEATLAQSGSRVTGTWRIAFPALGLENGGSLSGTASGSALQATLEPSDPTSCPFNLTATLGGATLRGTYAAFDCTGVITGSFTATRQ